MPKLGSDAAKPYNPSGFDRYGSECRSGGSALAIYGEKVPSRKEAIDHVSVSSMSKPYNLSTSLFVPAPPKDGQGQVYSS